MSHVMNSRPTALADTRALDEAPDSIDLRRARWERLFDAVDTYLKEDPT